MLSDFCLFFFSSRRRHTRLTCDWSSDVCSSDLGVKARPQLQSLWELSSIWVRLKLYRSQSLKLWRESYGLIAAEVNWSSVHCIITTRSEERRVGKECRSRWAPDHLKKKKERVGE